MVGKVGVKGRHTAPWNDIKEKEQLEREAAAAIDPRDREPKTKEHTAPGVPKAKEHTAPGGPKPKEHTAPGSLEDVRRGLELVAAVQ